MSKRELQIPTDKILTMDTAEDLFFRSPSTIPDKGLRNLVSLKKVLGSNCSYYDIAPTENQALKRGKSTFSLNFFEPSETENKIIDEEDIISQFDVLMGEISE